MDPKPVADTQVLLAHWMGPTDANGTGNIHGGTIMKLADEAAGLAAIKHSRTRVTTAGVDRMAFLVPVFVGELVTFKAMVNAAWRTTMEMGVRVEAEIRRANRLAERAQMLEPRVRIPVVLVVAGDEEAPCA